MRLIRNIRGWIESHNYCFILLYFFFYMTVFTLEEQYLRPVVIVRCPLDDLIPFNSLFIIPYFAWFLLVPAVIGYFMFTSKEEFLDLCFMLFTGMTICLAIYAVVPNGIHLREMITGMISARSWSSCCGRSIPRPMSARRFMCLRHSGCCCQ